MNRTAILFLLLITIITANLRTLAEIRFVSKTGSSTMPYTSWATAADSIQKCINVAAYRDTIFVGNGTYEEYVRATSGISLIGSGYENCIIDSRAFIDTFGVLVGLSDGCLLSGFKIIVNNLSFKSPTAIGVNCPQDSGNMPTTIKNNLITDTEYGIRGTQTNIIIEDNIFTNMKSGIIFTPYWKFYDHIVRRNIFHVEDGVGPGIGQNMTVNNNIFYLDGFSPTAIHTAGSLKCYNNLIIKEGWRGDGIIGYIYPLDIYNNTLVGKFYRTLALLESDTAKNNIIYDTRTAISTGYHTPIVKYNCMWLYEQLYDDQPLDSTNIVADPMFIDTLNNDYHLQLFSPCIDAGDPSILDKDGSRSDIGVYGGPYGESYTYQDLAPKPPKNLTSVLDSGNVTLSWLPNTEADFYLYRIYRDTIPNFIYDTTKIIARTSDTTLNGLLLAGNSTHFKITAIDSQYNQSPASEEVGIIITSAEEPKLIANDYQFYPNYPNPFNPSTTLSYRLKENGTVRLVIYDMKGEKITELVNAYQQAGYYEVNWDAKAFGLSSGVYLFRIEIKNENNIPVFSDMRKSILLK